MNIYHVSRTDTTDYDEYDSMVVIAESEDQARCIHPYADSGLLITWNGSEWIRNGEHHYGADSPMWQMPWKLDVKIIGMAEPNEDKPRVVLGSFNAG